MQGRRLLNLSPSPKREQEHLMMSTRNHYTRILISARSIKPFAINPGEEKGKMTSTTKLAIIRKTRKAIQFIAFFSKDKRSLDNSLQFTWVTSKYFEVCPKSVLTSSGKLALMPIYVTHCAEINGVPREPCSRLPVLGVNRCHGR